MPELLLLGRRGRERDGGEGGEEVKGEGRGMGRAGRVVVWINSF